ncbi:hypothetical protein BH708_00355 [Brachybacterium sp. P6-10-X1]|uniref:hypothetical protein n=1 Tax=Brachybacterium sp. P6-10-X1 TaxID=1903186 RepID=UPI000971B9CF|nr:hypothetical protein [Brachybacterium sp. P6-10-X1]APX31433.1 hypothetical protein BH708_00355 [Brachybacterium sp. P6-10-X1]
MTSHPIPSSPGLIRIAAPPGTGKSTVLPHLVEIVRGHAVVADAAADAAVLRSILPPERLVKTPDGTTPDRSAEILWEQVAGLWEQG